MSSDSPTTIHNDKEDSTETPDATSALAWKAFLYCRDHPVVTRFPERCTEFAPREPSVEPRVTPPAPTSQWLHVMEHWEENHFLQTLGSETVFPEPLFSIPCLIRDAPGLRDAFAVARRVWLPENGGGSINRTWFLERLGTASVPVRVAPPPASAALDDQGRATECPIQYMTLQEYITEYLVENEPSGERDSTAVSSYYLKDWHLQQWLERHTQSSEIDATGNTLRRNDSTSSFLYTLPNHLPYDLLNGFLLRFGSSSTADSETNDYRFVYWGPKGSSTALHSDVLQSLSWSYNVSGTKQWTFYVPPEVSGREDEATIVVLQNAGELMIVPSGWKHSVVNLEETLSINHNWITADILSNVWMCMEAELRAVDAELAAWSIDDFAARESMLRGCVGLNVSLFGLMLLTRGLDLLDDPVLGDKAVGPNMARVVQRQNQIRDLKYICESLRRLLWTDAAMSDEVHWTDRLTATLQSEAAGHLVQQVAMKLIAFVEENV